MPDTPGRPNQYDSREAWLRAGANELRSYFESCGFPLPEKIRFAIAFTSTGRRSQRLGECWSSTSSGDGSYEIFIRADLEEPVKILGVLSKELLHTALPAGSGHGKMFKAAAIKIGLQGPMRKAVPGDLLEARLSEVAANLGPLPHKSLRIDPSQSPLTAIAFAVDRPKKQRGRMLKAHCDTAGCGYTVRVPAKWARKPGPPLCPDHGPMTVDFPDSTSDRETGADDRHSV